MNKALVIEPTTILQAWGGDFTRARIERLEYTLDGWQLFATDGESLAQVDVVILACGMEVARLAPEATVNPVRGQVSWVASEARPSPLSQGSYLLPTRDGFLFGATHDRDDQGTDVRETDHLRNLTALRYLAPELAEALAATNLLGRAAIRATTTDYFPLAGALTQPGLFVLSGLGSRGFCWAPLLAEHVAAQVLGTPSPLPADLAALVEPSRFAARARRRGRNLVADAS
jgi:tRNA 5-methylaminomethyl-2-thiouridine biosynthesis bifunctional protein